jgi:hypothetical protein
VDRALVDHDDIETLRRHLSDPEVANGLQIALERDNVFEGMMPTASQGESQKKSGAGTRPEPRPWPGPRHFLVKG